MRKQELYYSLESLRAELEQNFRAETAKPGTIGHVPSAGQCAAVAAIAHEIFGGELVSAYVDGESHWFNRLRISDEEYDFDLTGDQYGRSAVQVGPAGTLYLGTRLRSFEQLNQETLERAYELAKIAHHENVAHRFRRCAQREHANR